MTTLHRISVPADAEALVFPDPWPCSSSETTIRIASGRAIDAAAEAQVWVVDGSYYQEGESEAVG
ncbi:hypothetical protein [Corynebacterium sp. HMSC05D03]|uniref:hypothetical protein n=1 Tax=Corynebacterium sp. HMSC05D03 TaxID=1581115 RepID=UPI0014309E81|nr:hypothetical protein [Corynebacterium sp. HMSC05D03]MDK6807958.1 hypothetical protein [Corynebacterium aurimucosum]NJJ83940.1 hypothetical protein [Corynebacterium aurimucosum]